MEGEMEQEQPRPRHTRVSRGLRPKRIVERLRGGWAYDEIARAEGLKARRVRQIVAEFLKGCEAEDDGTHARMQIERLGRAMRVAGDAMEEGDLRAIGPFIRAIDRLDRYQALAREAAARETKAAPTTKSDGLIFKELVRRIERDVRAKIEQEPLRDAREASGSPTTPDGDPAVVEAPAARNARCRGVLPRGRGGVDGARAAGRGAASFHRRIAACGALPRPAARGHNAGERHLRYFSVTAREAP
jgi:hypothetical protein